MRCCAKELCPSWQEMEPGIKDQASQTATACIQAEGHSGQVSAASLLVLMDFGDIFFHFSSPSPLSHQCCRIPAGSTDILAPISLMMVGETMPKLHQSCLAHLEAEISCCKCLPVAGEHLSCRHTKLWKTAFCACKRAARSTPWCQDVLRELSAAAPNI